MSAQREELHRLIEELPEDEVPAVLDDVRRHLLAVRNRTVVVAAAKSNWIARELEARGIDPVRVDYSEVTRIPGSFRCSTMPLVREGLHIAMMLGNLATVRRPMMIP